MWGLKAWFKTQICYNDLRQVIFPGPYFFMQSVIMMSSNAVVHYALTIHRDAVFL